MLFYVFISLLLTCLELQMSPADGAPEEFDQTIFTVQKDGTVGSVERLALNLIKEQQR